MFSNYTIAKNGLGQNRLGPGFGKWDLENRDFTFQKKFRLSQKNLETKKKFLGPDLQKNPVKSSVFPL